MPAGAGPPGGRRQASSAGLGGYAGAASGRTVGFGACLTASRFCCLDSDAGCDMLNVQIFESMTGTTPSCQPRTSVAGNTFPSIGRIARNISAGLAIGLPLAAAWIQPAQAVLIYNFYESGSDLVIEGTGSLNLPSPFGTALSSRMAYWL